MTNYDRIKQMTFTELSYFLDEYDSHCNFCIYNNSIGCISNQCITGIKKWLEKEV